jgi:hypothetical protein
VKECHMKLETMARDPFHNGRNPGLQIDVENVVIQSTNAKWEVVNDLTQTQIFDKENGVGLLHKLIKVNNITVSSVMGPSDTPVPIIEGLPVAIKVLTQFDGKTNLWKSSSLELVFEEINFSLTHDTWKRLAELGLALRDCFGREIPSKEAVTIHGQDLRANKLSYGLTLHRFVIEFLDGDEGFTFFGFGLSLILSPERLITYIIKDLGGRGQDQPVQCWESVIESTVAAVTFRERKPSVDKEPQYMRLLTQCADSEREGLFVPENGSMVTARIMNRTKVEGDEATKRRVPTLEAHVSMHGVQVVFDKQVWRDLYTWIIEGPLEYDLEKRADHFLQLFQEKRQEGTLSELKDFYYMNAKFNMTATETSFILPNLPSSQVPELRSNAIHFVVGKLVLTNQPDWPFPPFLKDALSALPEKRAELCPEEGTIHKFQCELNRVTCDALQLGEDCKTSPLLTPANLRLYGRYFPPITTEDLIHKLELALHANELHGRMTASQLIYFHRLEEENVAWSIKVEREERERRENNRALRLALQGEVVAEVSNKGLSDKDDMTIEQKQKLLVDVIKYSINNFHITVFMRFDKVTLNFPSPGALTTVADHWDFHSAGYTAEAAAANKEKEEVNDLVQEDSSLSLFKMTKLDVLLDNIAVTQSVLIRLKSFEASGLDHPRFPAAAIVRPLLTTENVAYLLSLQIHRKCPRDAPQSIDFSSHLQGLQVVSVGREASLKDGLREVWPKIRDLAMKVLHTFQDNPELRKKVVDHLQQGAEFGYGVTQQVIGNLNLNNFGWKVELGECEFKHVDTDDQIESPSDSARGLVRLSSSNKEAMGKQFKDVEDQLINSKLSLAQIQAEKFDLQNEVSVADERFNKLKNEMKTLEQQLVQTKISLAEAQAENDNLKAELKKVQSGAPMTAADAKKKVSSFFGRK